MRKTNSHFHSKIGKSHIPPCPDMNGHAAKAMQLDRAIDDLNREMHRLEEECSIPGADIKSLTEELRDQIHTVEQCCREWEHAWGADREAITKKQLEFRERTNAFFSKSYFMNRARTWPRGYPGDYETIEKAYNNQSLSDGIGRLLDRYFLSTTLANGIRYRRALMREILGEELRSRRGSRVLNIGCGPCREVVELAAAIKEAEATFTCIDFDADALMYSARRLHECGLAERVELRQYNALRMISAERTLREFGRFDIIYTIGLLDYLSDDVLIRLIKSLYATLSPGGVFVAVFKDADRYDTIDYHWLVDWSGFRQRTRHDSWRLIQEAGIPIEKVTVQRSQDDVMIFYRILHPETAAKALPVHGPHDRLSQTIEPTPRRPSDVPVRTRHKTPSERK